MCAVRFGAKAEYDPNSVSKYVEIGAICKNVFLVLLFKACIDFTICATVS